MPVKESWRIMSIRKNYVYNFIYQVLLLALPFVTVPYVSRVLGAEGVGIYSYTYSIVYYFMICALLGINNHGNRMVAKARSDRDRLSQTFWSIYFIQLAMSVLMTMLYTGYILMFNPDYKTVAIVQMLYIVSAMFDINWFFFGLEEFKITVTRNAIVRLFTVALIFLFVKTPEDVWLYTFIMAGGTLMSQLVLWPFMKGRINSPHLKDMNIKRHLKPCLVLFVPVIAVSLYKVMDKIMLGLMSNVTEVGYYEQAEKMVNIPLSLITALGTVMMPRISFLMEKGDKNKILEYIEKSIRFMMFMAFPICFGLIAIANTFVPIFMGAEFEKSALLVMLLSSTIVFISFANVLRTQYLIPKEEDGKYMGSIIMGAIVNLIANFMLIPFYASAGACIGTILAEFTVMIYQIIVVRKTLPVKKYLCDSIVFFVKGAIMFGTVMSVNLFGLSEMQTLLVQIAIGLVIYAITNYGYVNNLVGGKIKSLILIGKRGGSR